MSESETTAVDTHELGEHLRDLRARVDELRGRL
jgi:hypothetical protein